LRAENGGFQVPPGRTDENLNGPGRSGHGKPSPLDEPFGGIDMDADLSELELGIVTSLQTLREVLKRLSIGGRRWWIASDPLGAVEDGYSAPERWLYR
jgi:hypothetical protein